MYEWFGDIPPTEDYERFSEHFDRKPKDIVPLMIHWEALGWNPKVKGNGDWDYKGAFHSNGGSSTFVNEFGQKFALLVRILEISQKNDTFSEVANEVFSTIQNLRLNILRMRWRKYGTQILQHNPPEFQSKLHKNAVINDIFRVLCLDFLNRHGTMNKSDIIMIWSILCSSSHTLDEFRKEIDSNIGREVVYPNQETQKKYDMGMGRYWAKEFEAYRESFGRRLIPNIDGTYNGGFQSARNLEDMVKKIMGDE